MSGAARQAPSQTFAIQRPSADGSGRVSEGRVATRRGVVVSEARLFVGVSWLCPFLIVTCGARPRSCDRLCVRLRRLLCEVHADDGAVRVLFLERGVPRSV